MQAMEDNLHSLQQLLGTLHQVDFPVAPARDNIPSPSFAQAQPSFRDARAARGDAQHRGRENHEGPALWWPMASDANDVAASAAPRLWPRQAPRLSDPDERSWLPQRQREAPLQMPRLCESDEDEHSDNELHRLDAVMRRAGSARHSAFEREAHLPVQQIYIDDLITSHIPIPHAEEQEFNIFVVGAHSRTWTILVRPNSTVSELRHLLLQRGSFKMHWPADADFWLVHQATVIFEYQTMRECNIGPMSRITLRFRARCGSRDQPNTWVHLLERLTDEEQLMDEEDAPIATSIAEAMAAHALLPPQSPTLAASTFDYMEELSHEQPHDASAALAAPDASTASEAAAQTHPASTPGTVRRFNPHGRVRGLLAASTEELGTELFVLDPTEHRPQITFEAASGSTMPSFPSGPEQVQPAVERRFRPDAFPFIPFDDGSLQEELAMRPEVTAAMQARLKHVPLRETALSVDMLRTGVQPALWRREIIEVNRSFLRFRGFVVQLTAVAEPVPHYTQSDAMHMLAYEQADPPRAPRRSEARHFYENKDYNFASTVEFDGPLQVLGHLIVGWDPTGIEVSHISYADDPTEMIYRPKVGPKVVVPVRRPTAEEWAQYRDKK